MFQQLDFAEFWTFVFFPLFPLACWLLFLFLCVNRRKVLACEEQREVPWGILDVFVLFGTMMFAKLVGQLCAMLSIAGRTGLPLDAINQKVAVENADLLVGFSSLFSLLQLAFGVFYLRFTQKAGWQDLGWNWQRWRRHLGIGLVTTLMVVPLVLLVNIILHALLRVEYSHQVMLMVRHSLVMTGFSTILVAPLVEEFHFRVVLQGWLQRVHDLHTERKIRLIQGDRRVEKIAPDAGRGRKKESVQPESRPPWWPILLSSLLFASVHAGQGAAPYALFLFAIALGVLYRQTHSILPCLLVHLLLNLWSFSALIYSLD